MQPTQFSSATISRPLPLATLALVLETRNSASLTLSLCVMNVVNGFLWMTYDLVLSDS